MNTINDVGNDVNLHIDFRDVAEVRATWGRAEASPWAGFVMRHTATLVDGSVVALMGYEAGALLDALKAAGATLIESVEGWSRVCRVPSAELRATNEGGGRPTAIRPRPGTVEEAVGEMAALGKANKPGLAGRLDSAAGLVLEGRVLLVDERSARIGPYEITSEACTCGDFRHRGGWCKHRLAARMARHLVGNGFELPLPRVEAATTPQVSAKNLALIASGKVIDEAMRERAAYAQSTHGARTAALRMLGNGAKSLPAGLAHRAGVGGRESADGSRRTGVRSRYEIRVKTEDSDE